jgi:hypothetical protein
MFFKSRKSDLYFIKLFKIVDLKTSEEFNNISFVRNYLEFIESKFKLKYNNFSINYSNKIWKTRNGFFKALKSKLNNKIVDVLCSDDYQVFSYSNFLLNIKENIPQYGSIDVYFSIDKDFFDLDSLIVYLQDGFNNYSFDYGYIAKLTNDYSLESECKYKKSVFGNISLEFDKSNQFWSQHKYAMKKGFLRKIYPINFLNNSQLEQKIIKQLKSNKIGQFDKINSKITMWVLNKNEVEIAIDAFKDSKYLLATKDAQMLFENTQEALEYKKMTDIGLIWNSETCNYE